MVLLELKNNILKNGVHKLTSDYKMRNANRNTHNGMDFIGSGNGIDDVVAIECGKVESVGYNSSTGYFVNINTNGVEHRYFHLQYGSIKVIPGDYVTKGQVIGRMGKTGNATGYHLHFAILKNGTYVDPLPYLLNDNPFYVENSNFTKFVKEVQEIIGAKVDGISGPETLSKTITISTSVNWNHPLVKVLQEYLFSLGYNLGKYGIDGKFGPDMKKVIMDYQKNVVGLSGSYVDGVITARMYTWKSLLGLN